MMINIFIFTLTEDQEQPLVQYLMEKDRRGTYVVKEEVEKAPVHKHPCNLSRTAVKMTFPEMKQEVFMNLLGYKGSNMIYLNRCKGVCDTDFGHCKPAEVKSKEDLNKALIRPFIYLGTDFEY